MAAASALTELESQREIHLSTIDSAFRLHQLASYDSHRGTGGTPSHSASFRLPPWPFLVPLFLLQHLCPLYRCPWLADYYIVILLFAIECQCLSLCVCRHLERKLCVTSGGWILVFLLLPVPSLQMNNQRRRSMDGGWRVCPLSTLSSLPASQHKKDGHELEKRAHFHCLQLH